MSETLANKKETLLGSGKLYFKEFTGTLPTDLTTLEVDENLLGLIQGGATISYTPTYYESEDDLGLEQIEMLTKEEVVLKSGLMTWSLETLESLLPTARVIDNEDGTFTVNIGGIGNYSDKNYMLLFVHATKPFRALIVGKNKGGLEFTLQKDKETIIDAEFTAKAMDSEGTKLKLIKGTKTVE